MIPPQCGTWSLTHSTPNEVPVKVKIHVIPADAQSFWREISDTLHVWVSEDLDELAQHRYVQQAKREYGVEEERRRHRIIPLLPAGWGHAAGPHKTATAVGGGALALGLATTAVLVPILDGDNESRTVRPHAVAPVRPPAPSKPRRPAPKQTPPEQGPARPGRPVETQPSHSATPGILALRLPSRLRHPIGRTVPVDDIGSAPTPPHLPKPPAPPRTPPTRARPLLRVDLPPVVNAGVRLSPRLQIKVRLGSRRP